jgi:hypothetical protein
MAARSRDMVAAAWKTYSVKGDSSRRACAPRCIAAATAIAAMLAIALGGMPAPIWAQQAAPQMPDTAAGAGPTALDNSAASAQSQPPDPIGAVDDPGDAATVAVPGGGEVQAQGPSGPPSGPEIPPNETWGASRIDPNGAGTTPLGP